MKTRVDLYSTVHRGLRHCMLETQAQLGRLEPTDAAARAATLAQLDELLRLSEVHLEDEERFIHPAIEARAPAASLALHHDHEHHLAHLKQLRALSFAFDEAPSHEKRSALERQLDAFVADSLEHMRREEQVAMPLLQATWTDPELGALLARLVGSIAPADLERFTRWMLSGLPPDWRAAWLTDVRRDAPPAAFAGTLALAKGVLAPADYAALEARLAT